MTNTTKLTTDIQINLVCCTEVILQDIGCKQARQKDVALTYAMALKSAAQGADRPNWKCINEAILARWKMSGLERIKKLAFDYCTGKAKP
jgi:hypothetical protein